MASKQHIAQRVDAAYALLRTHTSTLAAYVGIEPPSFDGHGRYDFEYRRAEELHTIAAFIAAVAEKLQGEPIVGTEEVVGEGLLDTVTELVRSGNWTKAQVEALLLGDDNG